MNKLKAWIIAGRFFAAPWIFVNTLLGVKLAGFDFKTWMLSFVIVLSVLLAGHYLNAWRDYTLGFDQLENGSKAKPYTAASQVLPRGWLTLKEVKLSTFVFFALSIIIFILYAPKRADTIALFIMGLSIAIAYSDYLKPRGLGEIGLFLGHGFGASTFAYSLVRPITAEALAAGTLLGLLAGMVYTVDQWIDAETDFARRVKNYAYLIAKAEMRLSTFFYFAVTAVVTIHLAFVLMGILRASTLKALLLMPLFHFSGVFLDYHFEKGVWVALTAIWLYPILMCF